MYVWEIVTAIYTKILNLLWDKCALVCRLWFMKQINNNNNNKIDPIFPSSKLMSFANSKA